MRKEKMKNKWRIWLNRSIAIINATLQLYIYIDWYSMKYHEGECLGYLFVEKILCVME